MEALERHLGPYEEKVLILIDMPNLNGAQEQMQVSVDFDRLKGVLLRGRKLIEARLYLKGPLEPAQQGFIDSMKSFGFKIRPTNDRKDVDPLIIEDLKKIWPEDIGTVILVSGDRDYVEALREVKKDGRRVEVASVEEMASRELISLADSFINLGAIKEDIMDEFRTAQRYPPLPIIPDILAMIRGLPPEKKVLLQHVLGFFVKHPPEASVRMSTEEGHIVIQILCPTGNHGR